MSDLRLTRLASLWQQGLEAALAPAEEAELRSLLDDADLAEAWMELQVGREAAGEAAVGPVPARLRSAFQRQFKPWAYWGLRLGLPALGALLYLAWPEQKSPQFLDASVDETPFAQEQRRPERPAQKPSLGPPPGLDERSHLWVTRTEGALQFEVHIPNPALLEARIVDAGGQEVERLDLGRRKAGRTRIAWDGRTAAGKHAPAGRYRARVYLDGALETEKSLVIEKK